MEDVEALLSSVADVFQRLEEKQKNCKNGLLFLERLAASGYEIPAQVIIDFLQPVDTMGGAWILTTAVVLGLGNTARLLTKAGANLKLWNLLGYSPVHTAIERDKPELVRVLLEAGLVSPDEPTLDSLTPLILAAKAGSNECVRVLLECGASVNISSDIGETPLHCTARRGDSECLHLLLQQDGVKLDVEDEHGLTPLMQAVKYGHCKCVQMLLQAGANIREKNRGALHIAAFTNSVELLELLIKGGAPLDKAYASRDESEFMMPLHVAASVHAVECLRLLIKSGADVHVRTESGATPLHCVVEWPQLRFYRLIVLSIEVKALREKVLEEESAAMRPDCIRALLEGGADINARDNHSWSVLHTCAYSGTPECLQLLLDNGANHTSICDKGRTALHYAAESHSFKALKLLLEAGVSVHHKDVYRSTALHCAATLSHESSIGECLPCIEILVNAGADVLATTTTKNTPLDLLGKHAYMTRKMKKIEKEQLRVCVTLLNGNWQNYCCLQESM